MFQATLPSSQQAYSEWVGWVGWEWVEGGRVSVIAGYKLYYQMGNKQSKSYKPPSFKRENWHLMPSQRRNHRPEHGMSYLYRNNLTSEQVEEYQIYFHNQAEYQKYLQFFEWREREDTIVNTKFINSEQTKQFCNTNHHARIYIEHIPLRLSHIEDIPYPQNLYLMFSALDGFEKLFHFVGYFRPEEDFICIDRDGRVKVWLNSDLSKCHTMGSQFSDQTSNFHDSQQYQDQMVTEILELVEKNTQKLDQQLTFTQYLWKMGKQKLTFKQAKQEIINYAKLNKTEVPNYFQSVLSIYDEDRPSDLDGSVMRHEEMVNRTDRTNQIKGNRYGRPYQEVRSVMQEETVTVSKINSHNQNTIQHKITPQTLFRPSSQTLPPTFYRQNSEIRPQSPVFQLTNPPATQSMIHPQVKFNYAGSSFAPVSMYGSLRPNHPPTPIHTHYSTVIQPTQTLKIQPKIQTPPPVIQKPAETASSSSKPLTPIDSTVRDVLLTNKLLYSDTSQTYELDQQIVKDIIKYFG